jgi:hypothetical protein
MVNALNHPDFVLLLLLRLLCLSWHLAGLTSTAPVRPEWILVFSLRKRRMLSGSTVDQDPADTYTGLAPPVTKKASSQLQARLRAHIRLDRQRSESFLWSRLQIAAYSTEKADVGGSIPSLAT